MDEAGPIWHTRDIFEKEHLLLDSLHSSPVDDALGPDL
jgi:hypothetical protein